MADSGAEASSISQEVEYYNETSFIQSQMFPPSSLYQDIHLLDRATIEAAYEHCRLTIKEGSKGFYFAANFLPPAKRRAMWAVYNFCRYTDDLVDTPGERSREEICQQLNRWQQELQRSFSGLLRPDNQNMIAWVHTAASFDIPPEPPLELIEGVRMDLEKSRYETFEELKLYCYRVASTVGLMASQVIGYSNPAALSYAVNLGIAMQLTNILRDVGEDAANGRIYLPREDLRRFSYSEAELLRGEINDRFIELMRFQIARARHYYERALPGIEYLSGESRLAISVAAQLYARILTVIERNHYDVFTRRAYVPTGEKLRVLAALWFKRRLGRGYTLPNPFTPTNEEADA